jgi:hypothetical protein
LLSRGPLGVEVVHTRGIGTGVPFVWGIYWDSEEDKAVS